MSWKVVLSILTCNVVLMSASYTMLIPFLPVYLQSELKTPDESLNLWSGAIFAITFAVSAVMSPLWGRLADKKGRKLMVLRSGFLIGLTYALGAIVTSPLQLFLVRVLQGFAAGMWPASLALMSAYTPSSKIGMSMGVMQSANICGGIVGPLFGGLLAQYFGMRSTFVIASSTIFFITLITLLFIKEPPRESESKSSSTEKSGSMAMLKNKGIRLILISCGLTQMVILLLQPIMTLYIGALSHNSENILLFSGLVFSLSGIAGAIAAPIWGRRGQAIGFYKTIVISFICAGVIIGLQSLPQTLLPFAILQFAAGLGFSGIFPSANAMLVNHTPGNMRGTAFGLLFAAQQVGGAVGPLIGGVIATFMELNYIFLISGLILAAIGFNFMLSAPVTLRYNRVEDIDPSILAKNKDQHDEYRKNDPNAYVEKVKEQILEEINRELETKDKISSDKVITESPAALQQPLKADAQDAQKIQNDGKS